MTEEMKSSESPPASSSFWSLPNDVALNILARISRIHHPSLSLASKRFRSILSSRDLDVTRTLMGKTEKQIYLYIKLSLDTKPCWFALTPSSGGPDQKLKPLPSFPYRHHPVSPTVVSTSSEIYLIGGLVNHRKNRRVFVLDCRCHQWRKLPQMRVPRGRFAAAGLVDGKLCVLGGCESLGEVYDPKTGAWEPYRMTVRNGIVIENLGFLTTNTWFVAEEKILCRGAVNQVGSSVLTWCNLGEEMVWRQVEGLDQGVLPKPPYFVSVVASTEGGRGSLTVWWVSPYRGLLSEVAILCAEISFQRLSREEVYGVVEWSKVVHTMNRSETGGVISLLSAAIVMR